MSGGGKFEWRVSGSVWSMISDAGEVLARIRWSEAHSQYAAPGGVLLGKKWEDARSAAESRALRKKS